MVKFGEAELHAIRYAVGVKENKKLSEEYIEYYEEYVKKFGKKTILLMQVGSFYEAYSVILDDAQNKCIRKGPDLKFLEELTDVCVAHKGIDKTKYDYANPYMWGFPIIAESKYINILIENNFTVVIMNQTGDKQNIKRCVTGIYSPGTYLDYCHKRLSNFIANIYIEELQQKNTEPIICTGMSAIDVSTGEVYIHESFSKSDDNKFSLDDAMRFVNGISPKEIIIYKENIQCLTDDKISDYLSLKNQLCQFHDCKKDYNKINFQRKFLSSIYLNHLNMIDILDSLNLNNVTYARKSLVHLLAYISDHYNSLVKELSEPVFYFHNSKLFLGNDAINQLNVIGSLTQNNVTSQLKYNNLLDIINKSSTNMGKRYINMIFVSPITDIVELNKIYDIVGIIINDKNKMCDYIHKQLKSVYDIERLYRKLVIGILQPTQLVNFISSFTEIYELFKKLKKHKVINNYLNIDNIIEIKKLNERLNAVINLEKARTFDKNNIKDSIFNIGIHEDIDNILLQIGDNHGIIDELLIKLNDLIDEKNLHKCSKTLEKKKIILKHTKQKGFYYQTTLKRYELIEKSLKEKCININNKKININDLVISKRNKLVDITLPFLKSQTIDIYELTEELSNLLYKYYNNFLKEIHNSYGTTIKSVINTIIKLDYYNTIARISKEYNYTRPIIKENKKMTSYISAKNLRHPIVERIIDHEYIPHNIDIGNDLKGLLIYGLNSSGKSVLMKAIGLSIIMAQSGFYVPAEHFIYYPYKALYTRITSNDNLFRGMSSYMLEMTELNAILKRSDEYTLVIGDEICRGTEYISGNAIVAASILKLSELKSTFVFATHLHELMDLDIIKSKSNIKAFHLSVSCDSNGNKLIYDRILKSGTGERIYGITVAKHIIKDIDFINAAFDIKNQLLTRNNKFPTNVKTSRYNSNLIIDKCELCESKEKLETHHINFQQNSKDGFIIDKPHIKMNHISNLIVLCDSCHDKIHSGEIKLNGIVITSNGKKLLKDIKK